jgi:phosphatidylglycerophosphatase A
VKHLIRFIATGAYTGYSPIAPGTAGSALAWLCWFFIPAPGWVWSIACVVLYFIGVYCATKTEETHGHDASIITVDEIVGMWVSVLFLPSGINPAWKLLPFLLFRLFDIIKPFPANRAESLSGGWGVMTDDVAAGIYANLAFRIIRLFFH